MKFKKKLVIIFCCFVIFLNNNFSNASKKNKSEKVIRDKNRSRKFPAWLSEENENKVITFNPFSKEIYIIKQAAEDAFSEAVSYHQVNSEAGWILSENIMALYIYRERLRAIRSNCDQKILALDEDISRFAEMIFFLEARFAEFEAIFIPR